MKNSSDFKHKNKFISASIYYKNGYYYCDVTFIWRRKDVDIGYVNVRGRRAKNRKGAAYNAFIMPELHRVPGLIRYRVCRELGLPTHK